MDMYSWAGQIAGDSQLQVGISLEARCTAKAQHSRIAHPAELTQLRHRQSNHFVRVLDNPVGDFAFCGGHGRQHAADAGKRTCLVFNLVWDSHPNIPQLDET